MKKVAFCLLVLALLAGCLAGCVVIESPEPTHVEPPFTGERQQVSFGTFLGINYRIFNDGTAEVDSLDDESFTGTVVNVADHYDKYPVVGVADGAFQGKPVTEVTLPEGIRSIGARAFRQSAIRAIVLPDTLTFVGEDAFDACRDLAKVTFGASLSVLSTGMFYDCDSLTEIDLPRGVTEIGEECFSECDGLERITLPDTVTVIGAYAFWNTGTKDLAFDIPAGVTAVGAAAFRDTAWLKSRSEEFVVVGAGVLIRYNGAAAEVTVPADVRYLADAFAGTGVKKVILHAGITGECRDAWEETEVVEIVREGA